jgi:hypothetical protein
MKKLRLDVDSLAVESFRTLVARSRVVTQCGCTGFA